MLYPKGCCQKCGSCGIPECCEAPTCAYFDVYAKDIAEQFRATVKDRDDWRKRALDLETTLTQVRDARLIAAAPDLLEACRDILCAVKIGDYGSFGVIYSHVQTAYNNAKAAIAKAEGA